MVDSPDFEVREAREEEYAGAAVALANAFAYDPVMSQAMGGAGQEEKVRRLFDFQIRKTYAPRGRVDVAVDAQGQVLGAALWISPQGQKGSLLQDIVSLPSYFRVLGKSLLPGAVTDLRLIAPVLSSTTGIFTALVFTNRPEVGEWVLPCWTSAVSNWGSTRPTWRPLPSVQLPSTPGMVLWSSSPSSRVSPLWACCTRHP